MNKKRIAALIAASTMLLSALPINAAELKDSTNSQTSTSAGTVYDWDKTPIYKVTLPTSKALEFVVDPYGLTNLPASGSAVEDLIASASGTIFAATGSGAVIKSKSSVPVAVGVKLYLTDTNATPVTLVTSSALVGTGSATNMYLAFVPSANKVIVSGSAIASYSAVATGIAITDMTEPSDDIATFLLDKAKYNVVKDGDGFTLSYNTAVADNYDATAFQISGKVSTGADWSAYTKNASLTLNAVFSYAKGKPVDGEGAAEFNTAGGYRLASGSAYAPATETTIANGQYSRSSTSNKYTITWKSGMSNSDKAIKDIKLGATTDVIATALTAGSYKLSDDKTALIIDGKQNTAIGTGAVNATRYIKVVFNDDSSATFSVKVNN